MVEIIPEVDIKSDDACKAYITSDTGAEIIPDNDITCDLPSINTESCINFGTAALADVHSAVGNKLNTSVIGTVSSASENSNCATVAKDELSICDSTSFIKSDTSNDNCNCIADDKLGVSESIHVSNDELGINNSIVQNEVVKSDCSLAAKTDLATGCSTPEIDDEIGQYLSPSLLYNRVNMEYKTSANEALGIDYSTSVTNEKLEIDSSTSVAKEELGIDVDILFTDELTENTEYKLIDCSTIEDVSVLDCTAVKDNSVLGSLKEHSTSGTADSLYTTHDNNGNATDANDESNIFPITDNNMEENFESQLIENILDSTNPEYDAPAMYICSSLTDFDCECIVNYNISIGSQIVVNDSGMEDVTQSNPSFYDEMLGKYRTALKPKRRRRVSNADTKAKRLKRLFNRVKNTNDANTISTDINTNGKDKNTQSRETSTHSTASTQTDEMSTETSSKKITATSAREPLFTIKDLMYKPKLVLYYTGFKTYRRFRDVLQTLGQFVYYLKYWRGSCGGLSIEDQFFLTLIKLRCNKPDFDLAHMFQISSTVVKNIYVTWINFMYSHLKTVNLWTEKGVVDHYMPEEFRKDFPSTRVLIDIVKFPLKECVNVVERYSVRKKRRTLKALIGVSPGGHISYISSTYNDSIPDRQIIEESDLVKLCEKGDSILAHRRFNVEDIFSSREIMMHAPYSMHDLTLFLKNKKKNKCKNLKNRYKLSADRLRQERKLAEKLLVLEKTIKNLRGFSILKEPMNSTISAFAPKIILICCMLHNLKSSLDS